MQQLKISDNRHYLITADGQPFFWMADTAWELFHRCSLAEAELYLDNRQAKGFNVIQAVILAEQDGLHTPTPMGHVPLIDLDPTKPNPAYFADVEKVIQMAAERGMYVSLLPTWGDKVNIGLGKGPQIFNPDNARIYGEWVGERFAKHDNVVWMNGGDRREVENGVDYRPVWRALAEGIKAKADQLMTYHPSGVRGSSMEFHHDTWLDFNTWQSSHGHLDEPIWKHIIGDWLRESTKPVLDSEPCYEDIPIQFVPENGYFTPYDIRRRIYRSVFAGGCGFTYGHNSIWQMYSDSHEPMIGARTPWHACLDDPAAFQVQHLKNLMHSRPYLTRIPDQALLISDEEGGSQHVRATRDSLGRYAFIYIPSAPQTVKVDLARLRGETFKASWFNPRNGEITEIGAVQRQDEPTFITDWQGPDWVLILDSMS